MTKDYVRAPMALIMLAASGAAIAQVRPPATAQPRPAAPAAAQPRPAAPAPMALQRSEFLTTMDNEFLKMDADKDGMLTAKEIGDYQRVAALALASDRNRAQFAQLDTDRNGSLSPAEFQAIPTQVPQVNPATVMAFDGNRDGRVSKIENRAGTLANFDRIDADKDGIVTAAEMRAGGINR